MRDTLVAIVALMGVLDAGVSPRVACVIIAIVAALPAVVFVVGATVVVVTAITEFVIGKIRRMTRRRVV